MKFEAGDIVTYRMGGELEIEGVVIKIWTEPNPWQAGTIENMELFVTFDVSYLPRLNKIEIYKNVNREIWKVKA